MESGEPAGVQVMSAMVLKLLTLYIDFQENGGQLDRGVE